MEFQEKVGITVKKKVSSSAWGADTLGNQNNNRQKLEKLLVILREKQKEKAK